MHFILDGRPIEFETGDTILQASLRAGHWRPGCLCLAGDCANCLGVVDGIAYIRTCLTQVHPGMLVDTYPAHVYPPLPERSSRPDPMARHEHVDLVVVGGGPDGLSAAAATSGNVVVIDDQDGNEALAIYEGPRVIARIDGDIVDLHAKKVVLATGRSEIHPVCPGNQLPGILTRSAFEQLDRVGLGRVVKVGDQTGSVGALVRFEGADRVEAVIALDPAGNEVRHVADTVVVALGEAPRDILVRMATGIGDVVALGSVTRPADDVPCPTAGTVCPCSGVEVSDLDAVWERGFRELDLIKRATLSGTGTCQGVVCAPHVRSFIADRSRQPQPPPFTARPLARQMTMGEAAAGSRLPPIRRTGLHAAHLAAGARMDRFGGWWRPWNYGDTVAEYWAVREAVSLGDVGTLGKFIVSGPDAVEFLERLYPCRVGDLAPGRSRYALVLDERGTVIDDGMINRLDDTRFSLSFTSGGAGFIDMWMRDWAATWNHRINILDRTLSQGAINVTGPLARELLLRAGVAEPPSFLRHFEASVAGVPCHIYRLSFTGEASFELHHPYHRSDQLWQSLLALGADLGIRPHGLDTLFTLRLEKGHIIIGMDTEADSHVFRLGMEWAARMEKPDFIGRHALTRLARIPVDRRLVGLVTHGEAPIEGAVLWDGDSISGYVSGSRFSPTLGHPVMLGWVRLTEGTLPTAVRLSDGRTAQRVPTPFFDPEGLRARA